MPRLDKETRERIKKLDYKELQDIVLKLASKEKPVYDYIFANYLDRESGEKELFEATKADLEILFRKRYKGFITQLQLANMLGVCIRRVNEFTKISNNRVFEAELLIHILEVPFAYTPKMFGTCFTQYDSKVAVILKRLITVVTKKLHEDYRIEYENKINTYLKVLHDNSGHLDAVYKMPKAI